MLTLRCCRVLRTPKTGSKWLTAALEASCKYFHNVGNGAGQGPNGYHATLRNVGSSPLKTVAFVRHPFTWYGSYWNHRVRLGWKPEEHPFDATCADPVFSEFMKKAIDHFPGYCSRSQAMWVGEAESGKPIDFVGRFEHLHRDTTQFLELFREPYDSQLLLATAPRNGSDYQKHPAELSPSMKERIEQTDCGIINRFY